MEHFISNGAFAAIAAGALLISSCSDRDLYNSNYKKDEYAANWEAKFGQIDPTQDWNMATKVTANANIPGLTGQSVLNVYTDNPILSASNLLATVVLDNGQGSATFDALKGMDQVFVAVKNNGKNVVYGYADVENGTVNAGKTTSKKAAKTRAASDVTQGETTTLNTILFNVELKGMYTWLGKVYTWDELVAYTENYANNLGDKSQIQYKGEWEIPFVASSIIKWKTESNEWNSWMVFDGLTFENAVLQSNVTEVSQEHIKLTMLNGVEKAAAVPWKLSWGYEMFGPGSFFQEQVRYYTQKNTIQGYNLDKVEQGFSITSTGGEITLPFIYGATQNANRFGYIYYKDGQDPLTQPHYILMNDGRPQSNIYYNSWGGKQLNDNMELSTLFTYNYNAETDAETLVYGTEYKLAFFGENHDQPATYTIPAGYHIVFFIAPYNGTSYNEYNFNYSLPELNARIGHKDGNSDCPTYHPERGAIKATAWTYNGCTFLGFEDGGNDEDLNDIVFWVEGRYDEDQDIPEVPTTTPIEETKEYQSWILACEDLGDTDDYDFNDIVLEVVKKDDGTIDVKCLAAGGTLPANILYDGMDLGEVHDMFGVPTSTMVNTINITNYPYPTKTVYVGNDWTIADNINKFSIVVSQNAGYANSVVIESPEEGKAPQIIVVPGEWEWPKERTSIESAYPAFRSWSSNANLTEWREAKAPGKFVKRR